MSDEAHAHEIVIIKRHGGGHEDAHHGGVWKIAFADFMTAMMAFFLVMWLISANDKTKATIAKYFNPVELVDSTPQPPGLNTSKKGDPSISRKTDKGGPEPQGKDVKTDDKSEPSVESASKAPAEAKPAAEAKLASDSKPLANTDKPSKHDEAELNRDPYAVLAEIDAKNSAEPPKQTKPTPPTEGTQGGAGAVGLKGGEAFRDPFQPLTLPTADNAKGGVLGSSSVAATEGPEPVEAPPVAAQGTATAALDPVPVMPPAPPPAAAPPPVEPAADRIDDKTPPAAVKAKIEALEKGIAAVAPPPAGVTGSAAAAGAGATGPAAAAAGAGGPKVEVRHTDEGLLISLTDSADFSMFANASAEPAPKLVALMAKIGHLLKTQKGSVTLRGFTDNRPFKSDTYDNWRLSAARAQIAHYMLVRGGLDDQRIDRIEGYADRRPKNPKDPGAAENRRIEILLRDTTP